MMIKREVNSALKENEDKLQSLIDTVQQLDSEADYESGLQNLEVSGNWDVCVLPVSGIYFFFKLIISPHAHKFCVTVFVLILIPFLLSLPFIL